MSREVRSTTRRPPLSPAAAIAAGLFIMRTGAQRPSYTS